MALISILLVFALEFYFRWGAELRTFSWFESFHAKLEELLSQYSLFYGWLGIALILLLPSLALWSLLGLFDGFIYYLLLLIVSSAVLFMCLGPKPLKDSFESYFAAMERGDKEAGYLALQQESTSEEVPQSDDLVRNATRVILVESQSRYFGVIFWFILFGPFGALFYRLTHLYYCTCLTEENEEHLEKMTHLLHWVDWAPVRITSLLFLVTGDFVNGFYRVKDYMFDASASNRQLISETGVSALGIQLGMTDSCLQENYDAMAMIERTMIVYLVVVVGLSPIIFW